MKTRFVLCRPSFRVAALLAVCIPTANAQTLTLAGPVRIAQNALSSGDSLAGPFSSSSPTITSGNAGALSIRQDERTPASQTFLNVATTVAQDSTVTATSTQLHASGLLRLGISGSANLDQFGFGGSASWTLTTTMEFSFSIDQPFAYVLTATTSRPVAGDLAPSAFVGLGGSRDRTSIGAFGSSSQWGVGASDAGTFGGILPAGAYALSALAQSSSESTRTGSPISEEFTVSFTLDVTTIPQPLVTVTLAPDGPGLFQLKWDAPQAGVYRILFSSNLKDWTEYTPAATWPAGLNKVPVNVGPGGDLGFFRIQYLP